MSKVAKQKAVDAGIRRFGSLRKLAERLGVRSQAISQWDQVPAKRVLAIEAETGVSRYELRPDIYGEAPVIRHVRPTNKRPLSRLAAA